MGGRWRMAGALACVCAGLASAGCGDSDDGGAGNGMARGGLGPERHERVEAVIDASGALTDFAGSTDDLRTACEALDEGDPLLAALRRSCAVTIKVVRRLEAAAECGEGSCAALGAMADAARQQVEAYAALDEAVGAAQLSGDCGDAVRAPDSDVEYIQATAKAFDLIEKARGPDGAEADAEEAVKLLNDAAQKSADAPDPLERFEEACGAA